MLTAPDGSAVTGSVALDKDGAGFTFIATAGDLAPGAYTLAVRGTAKDERGRALDGSSSGVAGNDLITRVTVASATDTISMTPLMRGPGQTVSALPVAFTGDGTVQTVSFAVDYDPALLTITGATAAAGLPAGVSVQFTTGALADGRMQAVVTVDAPSALPAGTAALVDLQASVPTTAGYGAVESLGLAITSVNGVAQALPAASGLQVVGYLGDANGDGTYSTDDATRILTVVGGAESGFAAWRGVDPAVVADTNGDGKLDAADAALIGTTALPAIPAGITIVPATNTPFVSVPSSVSAAAGSTVTVPVSLSSAMVLSSGQITLNYDASMLDLVAVRADAGSGLSVQTGAMTPGQVTVTVSPQGSAPASGVLALFDFAVKPNVQPGTLLPIDLSAVNLDGRALDSRPGADGTDGLIDVIMTSPGEAAGSNTANPVRLAQAQLLGGMAA